MNITIDANYSKANVTKTDNTTTTYKPSQTRETSWNGGYTLDIADKVMEDKAYQGHGMTTEDIMQQAQNTNAQTQKDFMIVMSNSVSGEDLQKLAEDGFKPGSTDVETYVSILDKIKVTLAKAGVNIKGFTDNIDAEEIEEITGSKIDVNELMDKFNTYDMPVTRENLEAVADALQKGTNIIELSEDTIKYLIMNQKSLTIENIYLAQYKSASDLRQAKGYFNDAGYLAKKADEVSFEKLMPQIENVVKQSGLEANQETLEQAKWLVQSGIELTADNLTRLYEINDIEFPLNENELLDIVVCALGNGKAPSQALLTGEYPVIEQAQGLIDEVNSISDEAIHQVVEQGETLNIRNLSKAQEELSSEGNSKQGNSQESSLKEIEARRQMEEIRLMMTLEASRKLIKSGFSIDTTELSKLVNTLKEIEETIKSSMFNGKTAIENQEMSKMFDDTIATTKELYAVPAAVLGRVVQLSENEVLSLRMLHEEGKKLQKDYFDKAIDSYETLMTAPRKDLGDRISKAFRNIDDILKDIGMETNESNRRAVRILGYNSMSITKENIDAVKEADSLVTKVIDRMTPKVTLELIREKKNPLEMSIKEIDEYLSQQDKDPVDDSEKYSRYLQKLDRSGDITSQERQAYIGIYRMFRQIEKTDGAVIGSLVATGAEMSFKNVLSALRTAKKEVDVKIDEEYGALYDLVSRGEAIDAQIQAGFGEQQSFGRDEDKEKYYARISGEIKDELARNTSMEELRDIAGNDMENLADMTVEGFYDELKAADNQNEQSSREYETQQKLMEFRQQASEAASKEDAVIQSLIDYEQPVSIDNIQAASMLMYERGQLFKQVFAGKESQTKERLMSKAKDMIEGLTDEVEAKSTYKELINEAIEVVESSTYKPDTTHLDIKAAKALYKGLSLAGSLSREENYEIPVELNGELTSVNLKIYHNSKKLGKVTVTMESDKLGKVACEFDVTNDKISGMVAFDEKKNQEQLDKLMETLKNELKNLYGEQDKKLQISLANAPNLKLDNFGQDREIFEDKEKPSTTELYKTAKAFMTAISSIAA